LPKVLVQTIATVAQTAPKDLPKVLAQLITAIAKETPKEFPRIIAQVLTAVTKEAPGATSTTFAQILTTASTMISPANTAIIAKSLAALVTTSPTRLPEAMQTIAKVLQQAPSSAAPVAIALATVSQAAPALVSALAQILTETPPAATVTISRALTTVARNSPEDLPKILQTVQKEVSQSTAQSTTQSTTQSTALTSGHASVTQAIQLTAQQAPHQMPAMIQALAQTNVSALPFNPIPILANARLPQGAERNQRTSSPTLTQSLVSQGSSTVAQILSQGKVAQGGVGQTLAPQVTDSQTLLRLAGKVATGQVIVFGDTVGAKNAKTPISGMMTDTPQDTVTLRGADALKGADLRAVLAAAEEMERDRIKKKQAKDKLETLEKLKQQINSAHTLAEHFTAQDQEGWATVARYRALNLEKSVNAG
jgi:hypothetical protein